MAALSAEAAALAGSSSLESSPEGRRTLIDLARELRRQSRLDEAETLYRRVLASEPQHVRALVGLARIARARGDVRRALVCYQAAADADPTRTDLKLKVAARLRKLARVSEARRVYRGILDQEPRHRIARALLAKLAKPRESGLPRMEREWLTRPTFARAAEWGASLEALGAPAFGLSLLTLAQDFASGAREEVRDDCILVRRRGKTKILPFVTDWPAYARIVQREAAASPVGSLFAYVPEERLPGLLDAFELIECHREFVYHRESAGALTGSSLATQRRQMRQLLKAGAHVEPIGAANLERVLACNERWFAGKKKRGRKTYYFGRTLWTFENLPLLEELGVRHLAVVHEDDVVGYTVGSHIGASWGVFTFRRADREPWGIGPCMVSELAKRYPERAWINDGPAVRKPGLAFFKQRFTANADDKQMAVGWVRLRLAM